MDQEIKIVGVLPLFCLRLSRAQENVITGYFRKWNPDKILYHGMERISFLAGTIPNFELQIPYDIRLDTGVMARWITGQVDVLLVPVGMVDDAVLLEMRIHLSKADAQFISISTHGYQYCSGSPDEFHIPRRGRATLSHLTQSLIQANAAGLITPDQMQTALDTKVLPEWLSERLRTLQ